MHRGISHYANLHRPDGVLQHPRKTTTLHTQGYPEQITRQAFELFVGLDLSFPGFPLPDPCPFPFMDWIHVAGQPFVQGGSSERPLHQNHGLTCVRKSLRKWHTATGVAERERGAKGGSAGALGGGTDRGVLSGTCRVVGEPKFSLIGRG